MASTILVGTPDRATARAGAATLAVVAVFFVVFAIYNANGREIGSYDTQPTKYAALELAHHRTLILDRQVLAEPALAHRPGFARDRQGHYRSAYPVLPSLIAASVAGLLRMLRVIDFHAPLAASLVAKITASTLVALAAALAFVVARREVGAKRSLAVVIGFAFGTNLWAASSQTLWQSDVAVCALCAVVACLAVGTERLTASRLWGAALLLGLAGAARPQMTPAIVVLATAIVVRRRRLRDLVALTPLVLVAAAVVGTNLYWFGHALGAVPRLEALHTRLHATGSSFANPLVGAAGLLVSPSRGLLVFSPIVLVALLGVGRLRSESWSGHLKWWAAAAIVQFAFYSSYSVWWGGHTYGPRYCIDLLPFLLPLAVVGSPLLFARRALIAVGTAALAWSIALAATGAFVYPNEVWNTDPTEVDQHHERLWDYHDPQFVRCWKTSPSPQNFRLFTPRAFRPSARR